jgi:hypothetical protein
VDWAVKGRLLAMGSILIVLGLVLYLARGVEATLALVAVGIILLIAGVLWKPRKKNLIVGPERTELKYLPNEHKV